MNAFVLTLLLAAGPPDAPWPGFLGGGARASDVPLSWSPESGIAWQADLPGYGQSSPVIAKGKLFVTSVEGKMKDTYHVFSFDLKSGEPLWKYALESTDKAENTNYISRAAPTPLTDGKQVFAFFESGDMVALTLSGEKIWKRSLGADYGKIKTRHGLGTSPLQTEKGIVLLVDQEGPSYLLCVDKQTGEPLWKTERASRTSWSSPALVTVDGKPMIICSSSGSVDGYDPATGALLWSHDGLGGNTTNTPLAFGDGCFLVGASSGRESDSTAGKSNLAMQIVHEGDAWRPRILWTADEASSSFGSPIVHRGHAYFVSRAGVLYCLDAKTGEMRYTQRLKQSCWATPLGVDDRIYFFGKSGHTTVIAAGPTFQVLAESDLWEPDEAKPTAAESSGLQQKGPPPELSGPVMYGYGIAGGSIVFRRGDRLYCVKAGDSASPAKR